ncbi:MAG TPA: SMP-30/gluconolactonase/LRE family protein [Novosphingobium sp.]
MKEFTILARGLYLEGLAVDHATGTVWYSDVIGGGIHAVAPDGSAANYNRARLWTGGVLVNADGRILSTGQGGIQWTDPANGRSGWLINGLSGVNEMVPDGRGGILFGSVDLDRVIAGETPRPAGIYRLNPNRSVTPLAEEVGFVNGMMLSADGTRLFFNESFNGTFVADVRPDGSLGERTMLLAKYDCDGMARDAEGNLWITGFESSAITRIRPDGSVLPPFETPAGAITQLRFGGPDGRDVWFTAVPADAGQNLKAGRLPKKPNSLLYHVRGDIAGALIPPAEMNME